MRTLILALALSALSAGCASTPPVFIAPPTAVKIESSDPSDNPAGNAVLLAGGKGWGHRRVVRFECPDATQFDQDLVSNNVDSAGLLGGLVLTSAGVSTIGATISSDTRTGPIQYELSFWIGAAEVLVGGMALGTTLAWGWIPSADQLIRADACNGHGAPLSAPMPAPTEAPAQPEPPSAPMPAPTEAPAQPEPSTTP